VNREHLPATSQGLIALFAPPVIILWFLLVQPALDLLALRERGRRWMIVSCTLLIGVPVGWLMLGVVGGIVAMLAGASQWPPAWVGLPGAKFLLPPGGSGAVTVALYGVILLLAFATGALKELKNPATIQLFTEGQTEPEPGASL
jgi:hypothetical protein